LPSTIHSRLSKISFTKAKPEEIKRQLAKVVKGEKLKIDKEAIDLIAKAADGSFRDAVKIVEALITSGKKITTEQVQQYLQHVEADLVTKFVKLLTEGKMQQALSEIDNLIAQGVGIAGFVDNLIGELRNELLEIAQGEKSKYSFSQTKLIELIESLLAARNKIAFSPIEQLPLEIVVIEFTAELGPKAEKKIKNDEQVVKLNGNVTFDKDTWAKVVLAAKESNATVDALLRAVQPIELKDGELKLGVFYRFHKERLETAAHRRALEDIVSSVLGKQVRIACVLAEREVSRPTSKTTLTAEEVGLTKNGGEDILKAAEEIFGD
jgi:DNA polymerase III gamma/tau subunit